jgi:CubicO group peptidase (beta-lactamase class C family)
MADLQQQVQAAIDELVASGVERGLQVAVYRHGALIVDAVAGVADPLTGRMVTSDTPFFSYSVGKGVAATALHTLAERGVIDYDTPIVELWPEFGAHGKHRVTVRHALSQSAGVPGLPRSVTVEDLCDWDRMCAIIADEKPWWEAGTQIGYHAVTWGYIVGEIVRRASGRSLAQVLREAVAGPLGVADELFFAVPTSEQSRLAYLEDAAAGSPMDFALPEDHPMLKIGPPECTTAAYGNRADVRSSSIPAGGTVTARAVARMYAALLGEVDGVRLISPERLREVSAVAMTGIDQVFGMPTTWGLGYGIEKPATGGPGGGATFGVGGVGGSHAYADVAHGITFALTKNRLAPDFAVAQQIAALVATSAADA